MKPICRGELKDKIACATVTFDNGDVQTLKALGESANHFFERFQVGDDEIQLRLDWTDLDTNGQPSLDADFYNAKSGKKRSLSGDRLQAHRTPVSFHDARHYEWEFRGDTRSFTVAIDWLAQLSDIVCVVDVCSVELIHGTGAKPQGD